MAQFEDQILFFRKLNFSMYWTEEPRAFFSSLSFAPTTDFSGNPSIERDRLERNSTKGRGINGRERRRARGEKVFVRKMLREHIPPSSAEKLAFLCLVMLAIGSIGVEGGPQPGTREMKEERRERKAKRTLSSGFRPTTCFPNVHIALKMKKGETG